MPDSLWSMHHHRYCDSFACKYPTAQIVWNDVKFIISNQHLLQIYYGVWGVFLTC